MATYFVRSIFEFEQIEKKRNDIISFKCSICGIDSFFQYRKDREIKQKRLLCSSCSSKKTCLEKYGTSHATQSEKVKLKISKKVALNIPNTIFVNTLNEFLSIPKKSKMNIEYNCQNCGKLSYVKYDHTKQALQSLLLCTQCKRHRNKQIKYAFQNFIDFKNYIPFLKNGDVIQCECSNCRKNFIFSFKKEKHLNLKCFLCFNCKKSQTEKERFGYNYATQSPSVKKKAKETNLKKYGVERYSSTEEYKTRVKQTNLERYGAEYFAQSEYYIRNRRCGYVYEGLKFDSSWEVYFYIYHRLKKDDIERTPLKISYEFNGKTHYYFPDFRVNNQLFEIKGDQFFKKDGTMQNPYNHSEDSLFEAKRQCALGNNVIFVTKKEMKSIIKFVLEKYSKKYIDSFRVDRQSFD